MWLYRQHAPIHAEVLQKLLKDAPESLLKMVNRTLARVLALDVDAETTVARQEILNTIGTTLKPQTGQSECLGFASATN
jgi:hypothetical protein